MAELKKQTEESMMQIVNFLKGLWEVAGEAEAEAGLLKFRQNNVEEIITLARVTGHNLE